MATLLLTKNRLLRTAALLASLVLLIGYNGSTQTSAAAATSVRLRIAYTYYSGLYSLKIGAVNVFTNAGNNSGNYGCGGAFYDVTSTDPTVLAAISGTPGCTDFALTLTSATYGQSYTNWARLDVARGAGTEAICLFDNTGQCQALQNTSCPFATSGIGSVWHSPVQTLDTDQDGASDCSDPDLDNDTVLNAADNCPVNANTTQTDTDGNGVGDACQPVVVAVPWLGSEALQHQVFSGGQIVLQAAAYNPGNGNQVPLTSGSWDPGDGTGVVAIPVGNSLNLELAHTYTGSVGQPFTATVSVSDGSKTYTDTFKVVIASNSRETKVNMAIDKGLWNLHKTQQRTTSDTLSAGYWQGSGYNLAATASGVQAFEINNHRESGDPLRDPYGFDVKRALRFVTSSAMIQKLTTFTTQNGNNPDSNANGFGLWVNNNDHSTYIGGQVIDALVASGTPDKLAETGIVGVKARSYKNIVIDLLDGYSWGIADNTGGWHYGMQDTTGNNDTSASHWWAIGVLAAHTWNLDAPTWVKDLQLNIGVPLMQAYNTPTCDHTAVGANDQPSDGHFGYTNTKHWEWDNGTNTTAAGMVLLNADGVAQTNGRFTCASQFIADRHTQSLSNFYTMYQVTKAMRTARDASGGTAPITMLNGTIDWYAAYADALITNQSANGSFTSSGQTNLGNSDLASAWAIIILSPSLFELPPTASCSVNPATIGKNGGTVNFSAAASFHPDPTATITGYSWNFDDQSAAGSGVTTSHTYAVPASFPTTRQATVTVTDSNGNSSTASCPVTIVNNNVPPAVAIAGPYTVCKGAPLTLVATATDEDGTISATAWDLNLPTNFATIDATGTTVDATAVFASKAPGDYSIGFRATDDNGASSSVFSEVTVLAANDPSCNQPPTINMPPNQTIEATSPAGAVATFAATASDDHDTITPVCTPASGSTFGINLTTSKVTTVTCTATDSGGLSVSGTMTITIKDTTPPVVTVPAPMSVHAGSAAGAVVNYVTSATDIVDVTDPVTCDKPSGFLFPMGMTTVNCSSTDKHNNTGTANFTVNVTNAAPTANNDAITTHGNTAINVLGNDTDPENDVLTILSVSGAAHGSAFINPDKTIQYNPLQGQASNDAFTYTISDGRGGTSTASVTITITNAPPVAVNDAVALPHNVLTAVIPVLVNDSDPENDSLTIIQAAVGPNCHCQPFNIDNTNGTITYNGQPGIYSSPAQFTYTVRDKYGATATATVTVTFANAAPTTAPFFTTTHGAPVQVNPPLNSSDPDGDTITLVGAACAPIPPNVGFCNFNVGTGTVTFTPNPQWHGPQIQIGFTVSDGHNATASSFIQVKYVNQLPVPAHLSFTTSVNTDLPLNEDILLVGSTDPDNDELSIENAPTVLHGSIIETGPDAGVYRPNPGFIGVDTMTYDVDDQHGGVVTTTATITVTAPTATTISAPAVVYGANGVITVTVGSGASSAPSGSLSLSIAGGPAQTATLVNGSATFTMNAPAAGDYALAASYTGQDFFLSSTGTGTLHVAKAPSETTVSCPASMVFTGSALTPCTAHVTGVNLDADVTPVTHSANTAYGTASATATYAGDDNHEPSTGNATFTITKAPSVTVVTCPTSLVYTGSALTPCTAHVTGAGGLDVDVTPVTHSSNTNFGTASATATYAGDDNHEPSTGNATFEITKAPTVTVVTCPTSLVYTGSALTPCTANVTGAGGLDQNVTPVTHTSNTNVGTANATATYAGDDNYQSSTGNASFEITQAPTSTAITAPSITVAANGLVTVTVTSGSGTVLGNVSLTVDGGAAVSQALTSGSSVFTVASPNAGNHALVATYAAQGNFAGSTANGNLHVDPSPTATTLTTSATPQLAGTAVTFTATVVATTPGSGTPNGQVTFKEGATVLGTGALNASGVATFTTTTLSNGPHTITASYDGVNNYLPSNANTVDKMIYGLATGGGTFVISDTNATLGKVVNFWGSQWEKNNIPSGGVSNASFKGFATTPAVPTVGATFTAAPGNSAPQPSSVPQYIGIIVTSKVTKSGSNISGTIVKLVVVKVTAGYVADPGHAGTGTIVAFIQ